jgi:hypothetical protein
MTIGASMRTQLDDRTNNFRGVTPSRVQPQPQVEQQAIAPARGGPQRVQPQRPQPLGGPQAVQAFGQQVQAADESALGQGVENLREKSGLQSFLEKAGGRGVLTSELHGGGGIGGAYAANTTGGIVEIGTSTATSGYDPCKAVNDAWKHDTHLLSGNDAANNAGNISGAALGMFVSTAGIINSVLQIRSGNASADKAKAFSDAGQLREDIATSIQTYPDLSRAQRTELAHKVGQLADQLSQDLTAVEGKKTLELSPESRQSVNRHVQELNQIKQSITERTFNPARSSVQTLTRQLKADGVLLKGLGEEAKDDAFWNKLSGRMGLVSNTNGLVNSLMTAISITHATGSTVGNNLAQGLIFTQAVAGVGMAVSGAIGLYQDKQAHKAAGQRIERAEKFLAKPQVGSVEKKAELAKVKDVAELVKKENVASRKNRVWSMIKNGLMVVGGVALAVGVFAGTAALMATPIGWAAAGAAAAIGIGVGIYKLAKKHQQKNEIKGLETKLENNHQALKTANTKLLTQPLQLQTAQAHVDSLKPPLARAQSALGRASDRLNSVHSAISEKTQTYDRLASRSNTSPSQQARMGRLRLEISTLERSLPRLERSLQIRTSHANGLEGQIKQARSVRNEWRDLPAKVERLEKKKEKLESQLRQSSPAFATQTLVKMLQQNKSAAKDFCTDVLEMKPESLRGDPALLAETIRKKMGLAYL